MLLVIRVVVGGWKTLVFTTQIREQQPSDLSSIKGGTYHSNCIWVVNMRLFQPPATTLETNSVAVKQNSLFTRCYSPHAQGKIPEE